MTQRMDTEDITTAGPVDDTDGRTPWHDRPSVLVAATLAGVVGLAALAFSVVSVSDHATSPAPRPTPVMSVPSMSAPVIPEPTNDPPVVAPEDPTPSAESGVPDFAAGPTAETEVPPPPRAPAPDGLPRWLRRLFPNWNAGPG